MKAIVNTGPDRLEFLELPLPVPGAGQVRIRTAACAICATDVKMVAGWERTGFPSIPGHEWAGTVDAVGRAADESIIGKRCVAENVLGDGGEVGFEHPGGYGRYFLTEADKLLLFSDDFPMHVAALIEPLAVSVRALKRLGTDFKRPALIFGDGPIGLILLMLLVRAGVKDVVVVGGRADRLRMASELGARKTMNYHDHPGDMTSVLRKGTPAEFPTIIEASGSTDAAAASLDIVADCGRVLVLGDYAAARADFPWSHIMHRQIELIGSCASSGAWPEAVRLAVEGKLPLERLITHRFPAARFREAFALMKSRSKGVMKIILEWE